MKQTDFYLVAVIYISILIEKIKEKGESKIEFDRRAFEYRRKANKWKGEG